MSEKFTPHFFKTPTGESLAQTSVAEKFFQRQDLSPGSPIKPQLDQDIQIRLKKD